MLPSCEALLGENQALREEVRLLREEIALLKEKLRKLEQENQELKRRLGGKGDPPPFVKPARPGPGKKPGRKPGHPPANRPLPTQVDEERVLALDHCPHCGRKLHGPVTERVRYVEDILPPRAHVTR